LRKIGLPGAMSLSHLSDSSNLPLKHPAALTMNAIGFSPAVVVSFFAHQLALAL
jgi:hypothetical protein